jgi:signal peptidase I
LTDAIPQTSFDLPEKPARSHWAAIRETLETIALAVLFYAVISLTTARVVVDGPSMRPTLMSGEWIVINRLAYRFGQPQRGDVVVFLPPTNAQTDDLIKRVIGLPGETIVIRDGDVLIDGQPLAETYTKGYTSPDGTWTIGPGQIFVMGDNRQLSLDSRSFGPISLGGVVGKALVIYWPPSEWGPLDWRSGLTLTPAATETGAP